MSTPVVKEDLLPCALNFPYAFISYSSDDKDLVWADAVELQRRGYNLWIDEANVDKTKDSWRDDALKAIENMNCMVVLFYVSQNSLISVPCLNELEKTRSDATLQRRLYKEGVPFIAIETEPIGTMEQYSYKLREEIQYNYGLDSEDKDSRITTLSKIIADFLPLDNDKVRIHSRNEPARVGDYYEDIAQQLLNCNNGRELLLTPGRCYRIALGHYIQGNYIPAVRFAELASGYPAADLLLAHIYYTGIGPVKSDPNKAAQLWEKVDSLYPTSQWNEQGEKYNNQKQYSEALAFTLAYGEKNKNGDSMYEASKLWLKKGCRSEMISSLESALSYGTSKDAEGYLNKLKQVSEKAVADTSKEYPDQVPPENDKGEF